MTDVNDNLIAEQHEQDKITLKYIVDSEKMVDLIEQLSDNVNGGLLHNDKTDFPSLYSSYALTSGLTDNSMFVSNTNEKFGGGYVAIDIRYVPNELLIDDITFSTDIINKQDESVVFGVKKSYLINRSYTRDIFSSKEDDILVGVLEVAYSDFHTLALKAFKAVDIDLEGTN